MILECIDSLWFFSNLLTTPSPPLMLCREKPKETQPMTKDFLRIGPKARGPLEVLTAESTEEKANEESDGDPKCAKAVSTEQRRVESNQKQTTSFEAQNQIYTMSCGERGSEARPVSANRAHRRMRRAYMMERFVTPLNCYYALPSFSDSLAMRKHLKSWAQAVACTVR